MQRRDGCSPQQRNISARSMEKRPWSQHGLSAPQDSNNNPMRRRNMHRNRPPVVDMNDIKPTRAMMMERTQRIITPSTPDDNFINKIEEAQRNILKINKENQVQQPKVAIHKEEKVKEKKGYDNTEYEPVLFVKKDSTTSNEPVNAVKIKPEPENFYKFKQEALNLWCSGFDLTVEEDTNNIEEKNGKEKQELLSAEHVNVYQQQRQQSKLLLSTGSYSHNKSTTTSSYLHSSKEVVENKENVTVSSSLSKKEVNLTCHTEVIECHQPQAKIPDYTYHAALSSWLPPADDSQTLTYVTYPPPSEYDNKLFIFLLEILHDRDHTCIQEINFQKVLELVLQHYLHLILPRTFAVLLKVFSIILNCNKCDEKLETAGHVFKSWDIFVHHLSIYLQLHANSPQDISTVLSIVTGLKVYSNNLKSTVTLLPMTDIINFYETVKKFCSPDMKKECIRHLESLQVEIHDDNDEEKEEEDDYYEADDSFSTSTYGSVGSDFYEEAEEVI